MKTCRTCRAACNGAGREGNANQCTFHTTEGSSLPPPFDVESIVNELEKMKPDIECFDDEEDYQYALKCHNKYIEIVRKGGTK